MLTKMRIVMLYLLLILTLVGCANASAQPETGINSDKPAQLQASLEDYSKLVNGDFSEDLRLTVYCLSPSIETRRPLSAEDLVGLVNNSAPGTYKIVINAKELATNQATLRKLSSSALQPAKGDYYLNARVYYVFDIGETGKILEVAMWCYDDGPGYGYGVFVNGIAVENNSIFFELIEPFLTEEVHKMLEPHCT